jgi:hypothetical protein
VARARRVELRRCTGDAHELSVLEVTTNPALAPDLGHARTPFIAAVTVVFRRDDPGLGRPAGAVVELDHLAWASMVRRGADGTTPWSVDVSLTAAAGHESGLDALAISETGYRLESGAATVVGEPPWSCVVETLYAAPDDFLCAVLEAGDPAVACRGAIAGPIGTAIR